MLPLCSSALLGGYFAHTKLLIRREERLVVGGPMRDSFCARLIQIALQRFLKHILVYRLVRGLCHILNRVHVLLLKLDVILKEVSDRGLIVYSELCFLDILARIAGLSGREVTAQLLDPCC